MCLYDFKTKKREKRVKIGHFWDILNNDMFSFNLKPFLVIERCLIQFWIQECLLNPSRTRFMGVVIFNFFFTRVWIWVFLKKISLETPKFVFRKIYQNISLFHQNGLVIRKKTRCLVCFDIFTGYLEIYEGVEQIEKSRFLSSGG